MRDSLAGATVSGRLKKSSGRRGGLEPALQTSRTCRNCRAGFSPRKLFQRTVRAFPSAGPVWFGVLALLVTFSIPSQAWASVDRGTTQAGWVQLAALLVVLAFILTLFLWPIRWGLAILQERWGKSFQRVLLFLFLAVLISGGFFAYAFLTRKREQPQPVAQKRLPAKAERVIIIGMDGLDPGICEGMMKLNELPNFDRLRRAGTFSPLATSVPAESPVAWACAASGCNPGKHGLYDFIRRDAATYRLELSLLCPNPAKSRNPETMFLPSRHGPTFWSSASEANVPVTVIRWPTTFPPEPVNGRMLSGLGAPDINGGQGEYTFFTTAALAPDDKAPERVVQVAWNSDEIRTHLPGPMVATFFGTKQSQLSLTLRRGPDGLTVAVEGNDPATLKPGDWSGWMPLRFSSGFLSSVRGMVRFYLVATTPELKLYTTAVQVDPLAAAFPITYPSAYASELARAIGRFHTLGLPEDTQAVTHERYPLEVFLQQCDQVTSEREKMFDLELGRFGRGIFAFVFDTSDRVQHMTRFADDPQNRRYSAEEAKKFGGATPEHYKRMDAVVGRALAKTDANTILMVISDHGFASFRRSVHLNTWLARNGYLVFEGQEREGQPLLGNVDWARTQAYALGFCSLYINLRGREGKGSVDPSRYASLCEELQRKLVELKEPESGKPAVSRVYLAEEVYHGSQREHAPDLIVGYEPGYRGSWQTALGAAPDEQVLSDNESLWSGDHLVDPLAVPGVFFCNRTIHAASPTLLDIAPTVLTSLGIQPPSEMDGRDLF